MGLEIRIYKIETIVKKVVVVNECIGLDIWWRFCGRKTEIDSGSGDQPFFIRNGWICMVNELSENGLKRVMKQGARVNVNYNYFYTQTGVDHASIYTGMLPYGTWNRVEGVVRSFTPETPVYSTQSDRYTEIGDQQADSIKSLSPRLFADDEPGGAP